ncbi:MAG: DUF1902 domain-containing protein [Clostridiales bacterium]|jgi:hypothetical protein|nr:DUF1902 domain-containing protein [Clostridiales bacterium]
MASMARKAFVFGRLCLYTFFGIMKMKQKFSRRELSVLAGNKAEYIVNLVWDGEAAVWVATSEDIPGLVLESGSLDALMERVRFAIPELLELNGNAENDKLSICYRSERHEQVYA